MSHTAGDRHLLDPSVHSLVSGPQEDQALTRCLRGVHPYSPLGVSVGRHVRSRTPGMTLQLCHFLTGWPQSCPFTSLHLSFPKLCVCVHVRSSPGRVELLGGIEGRELRGSGERGDKGRNKAGGRGFDGF